MEMALDLMERLKISEGRTQPIGADGKSVVSWLLENKCRKMYKTWSYRMNRRS